MTRKSGETERNTTVRIEPNAVYRPSEVRKIFGVRFVNHLTQADLRAIGGWYYGKAILETMDRVWQVGDCQRVSGKEVDDETRHAEKEDHVEEGGKDRKDYAAPKRRRSDDLLSQMEEVG